MVKKNYLSLILAVLLALTACGMGAVQADDEAPYDGALPLVEEKQVLRVFTQDGVVQDMPPPSNDLPFWQYVEEQTNVTIEWETATSASFGEIVSTKLAAGVDLPDIFNCGGVRTAIQAGQAGILIPLTDLLPKYAPNTMKFLEENPFAKILWTDSEGQNYFFGNHVVPTVGQIVIFYNMPWLEQLGVEEFPTTTDEFLELARKMKGVDFNENGQDDEIILTAPGMGIIEGNIASAFGLQLFEYWDPMSVQDGVVSCDWIDPKCRDYLEYMHTLYQEGILDKEIFQGDWSKLYEMIAADKVGIVVCYSGFANTFSDMTSYGIANPGEYTYKFGTTPLKGPDGSQFMMRRERGGDDSTGVTRECKDPALAVKWLDFLYANPDCVDTRYWGFEGETYEVVDGKKVRLMPADGSPWSLNYLGCGQIPMPHMQTDEGFLRPFDDVQWYLDSTEALQPYFKSPDVPHITFTNEELDIYNMYQPDIYSYYREMEAKFIMGEESFDNWDMYVETMKALQIDQLTSVYQSVYDRTR